MTHQLLISLFSRGMAPRDAKLQSLKHHVHRTMRMHLPAQDVVFQKQLLCASPWGSSMFDTLCRTQFNVLLDRVSDDIHPGISLLQAQ